VRQIPLPAGSVHHYCYVGLRLLLARSGTYVLLPAGWHRQQDHTYILSDSAQIRIEFYQASGQQRPAPAAAASQARCLPWLNW
jgi:hypothetical protein